MLPEGIEADSLKHTIDRAIERYGVCIRPQELAKAIEAGLAEYKGAGHGENRKIYEVPVRIADEDEIVWIRVVYAVPTNPQFAFGKIITVLPPATEKPPASVQRGDRERISHKGRYTGSHRRLRRRRYSESDF